VSGTSKRTLPVVSVVPVVLVVLVTAIVVLVAALASSTGPTQLFEGVGPTPDRISASQPSETPTEPTDEPDDVERGLSLNDGADNLRWIGRVVRAILLGLVLVAVVLLIVFALKRRRPRSGRSRLEEDLDDDFAVADPLEAVAGAIRAGAEVQDAALQEGTPRNGIVAAWQRFESQAAAAGVPREDWETSTEFVGRLLAVVRADARAVADLAAVYRLARFSDHVLGEREREGAAEALRRIRASMSVTRAREPQS